MTLNLAPDVHRLMSAIDEAEARLVDAEDRQDMSPTNRAMSIALIQLVSTVQQVTIPEPVMKRVIDTLTPRLPRLHRLLGAAETEMEKYWARRFIEQSTLTRADLAEFLYMDNYTELTRREADACRSAGLPVRPSFLFIGSGPLPLSPILLQQRFPGSSVTCYDTDPEAVTMSRALIERLDIDDFDVRLGNGVDQLGVDHDVLMVAALVEPKRPIVEAALERGIDFVIARGAYGSNLVLYPPIDVEQFIGFGLAEVAFSDSGTGVINTAHVFASPNGLRLLTPTTSFTLLQAMHPHLATAS